MKNLKNGFRKRVLIHIFIGSLNGYFVLHPVSLFIAGITEKPSHFHWDAFIQSFSSQHIFMAFYFAVIGAVFGMIIAFYVQRHIKLQEKLRLISNTDELTGLLNRRGFFYFSQKMLKKAERADNKIALLFADLDSLKQINDTMGHKEGDRALISAADILRKTFRDSDIIARMGGDEFAVFLTQEHKTDFEIINSRLHKNIRAFNILYPHRYQLSMSRGIVEYDSERPCSIDKLLKQADAVMYKNKNQRQNSVQNMNKGKYTGKDKNIVMYNS